MKLKVPEMKLSAFFQTCKIIMEKSLCVFIAKKSNYLQSLFFNVKCNVFPTLWYGMRLDENEK